MNRIANKIITTSLVTAVIALAILMLVAPATTVADEDAVIVNVDNFVRAETAAQFDRALKATGGVNKWLHNRGPTPLDKQSVIRMNRDTMYSAAIVDISKGATLTLPDAGDRYMSTMVVNEDHYINKVFHGGGTYQLTTKEFDTPYVMVSVRTLVNANDPADIKAVNTLQDQFLIEAASAQPYQHPNYDQASYETTYKLMLELGRGVPDALRTFGRKQDVDPVRHLLATAWGWGGLPEKEAFYLNVEPNLPVGEYQITVKDVPVDEFWSISMYNKDGYFEKNALDAYSLNNLTATPNDDGSYTIHLGGCKDGVPNCLPLTEGWNYVVRMYGPHKEVIDGTWKFPGVEKVK